MIGLIGFLARFVTVLFLVRLTLRLGASLFMPRTAPAGPPPRTGEAIDLVRDRVCNTALPRHRAVVAVVGGREEHFCSKACAQRALSESTGRR